MRHGQVAVLLTTHTDAKAKDAARAEGIEALHELVALLLLVFPGVEHGEQAGPRVGLGKGEDKECDKPQDEQGDHDLCRTACEVGHDEQCQREHHDSALVRLKQYQGKRSEDPECEQPLELLPVELIRAKVALHEVRACKDDRDLRELGGLKREGPQGDPSVCAIGVPARDG